VTHSPCSFHRAAPTPHLPSFPTRRSSDLRAAAAPEDEPGTPPVAACARRGAQLRARVQPRTSPEAHPGERIAGGARDRPRAAERSEEHTSELQSRENLVCRLMLEKKNKQT